MFARTDLILLRDNLTRLSETPYFSAQLESYARGLIEVISHVIDNTSGYPPPIVARFTSIVWYAYKYLRGSISREIPYEVEYALHFAVRDWVAKDSVITTALVDDKSFHFFPLDSWGVIKTIITGYTYPHFDALLIQVALPRIYSNKPIFNVPLYHELGHFVDTSLGVTNFSFLISPHTSADQSVRAQEESHRREFFADLFAAQYVGNANLKILNEIAGGVAASPSHPATADRIIVSTDFLAGKPLPIVSLFSQCLTALNAPQLTIRYARPPLDTLFDEIRPYVLPSVAELHGIFEAGWGYLSDAIKRTRAPWNQMDEGTVERIINDLVEKSIRNRSIREKWTHGAAP